MNYVKSFIGYCQYDYLIRHNGIGEGFFLSPVSILDISALLTQDF